MIIMVIIMINSIMAYYFLGATMYSTNNSTMSTNIDKANDIF